MFVQRFVFFRLDMQVEFNKAAQSLSEALVPTNKKAALSRLLKVFSFYHIY